MTYTSNDVKFPFLFACFSADSGFKGMFSLAIVGFVVVVVVVVVVLVFLGSSSVISSLQNRAWANVTSPQGFSFFGSRNLVTAN